jgi:Rrf2 family protein
MLTQTSEYALRAMVYLARKGQDRFCGVKEIADATGVPFNYLAKILQLLARHRVLESQKGFGGGFRAARPLNRIHLLEIVDPLENIGKFKECVLGQRMCNDEVACPLHDAWQRISREYLGSLQNTTLQDVADFRSKADEVEGRPAAASRARNPNGQDKPGARAGTSRRRSAGSGNAFAESFRGHLRRGTR